MHIHNLKNLLHFVDNGPVMPTSYTMLWFSDKFVVTFLPDVDKRVHIVRQLSKINSIGELAPKNELTEFE